MKRSSRPDLDPATPPPRRRRALSEEERALWDSVAKQIKPLRKKARKPPMAPPVEEKPAPLHRAVAPKPQPQAQPPKPAPRPQLPPLTPLGRRERSQLSRGRKQIDARIDLHGMTQSHAHEALFTFLERANHQGLSFVLVITGKGGGAASGRGVLRRQVPQWLSLPEFRSLVIGFEEAHVGHGGAGALYVRVRRSRV
jgi:DNA-nicking Smr family endonuclease